MVIILYIIMCCIGCLLGSTEVVLLCVVLILHMVKVLRKCIWMIMTVPITRFRIVVHIL